MRSEEDQKTLISGRFPISDLPENDKIEGKIKINLDSGEYERL